MVWFKREEILPVGGFLLGGILAAFLGGPSADQVTEPLVTFGGFLRALSLESGSGNAGAWAIVIGLSLLPLLGLLRKERSRADCLLLLTAAEIFAMLYYLVNPTRVSRVLGWMEPELIARSWGLVSAGCILGTLVCWGLLGLLKILSRKPADCLPAFLFWTAVIYAFALGFAGIRGMEEAAQALAQGNSQGELLMGSRNMMILLQLLATVPKALGVWVILLAGKLALALEKEPFAEETVALAERISGNAAFIARLSLLLTVVGNGMQMLFFARLLKVRVEIQVPLLTLVLCAVLMLLCKYFRRAKEVSDDSATII